MRYMGSKRALADKLLPIMLRRRKPDQVWVEPFVGSGSVICKVPNPRIGNDFNRNIVSLLQAVSLGYIPPETVTKEEYYAIKKAPQNYPAYLVGFVSFGCSFGGVEWGSYAKMGVGNNYIKQSKKSILKIADGLKDIEWFVGDYRSIPIPPNSVIYCDPPYNQTSQYKNKFNSQRFYLWCTEMANNGHTIFVSEYSAPENFLEVLSIKHLTTMAPNRRDTRTEKLYRVLSDKQLCRMREILKTIYS